MENLIFLVHVLTAIGIIALILLQQGKGAEMGASFGAGASQTLFGATGSGNFFSKMTAILAFIFFVTSFSLAVIAKQGASVNEDIPVPAVVESADDLPAVSDDVPELDENSADDIDDLPELEPASESNGSEDLPEVND